MWNGDLDKVVSSINLIKDETDTLVLHFADFNSSIVLSSSYEETLEEQFISFQFYI